MPSRDSFAARAASADDLKPATGTNGRASLRASPASCMLVRPAFSFSCCSSRVDTPTLSWAWVSRSLGLKVPVEPADDGRAGGHKVRGGVTPEVPQEEEGEQDLEQREGVAEPDPHLRQARFDLEGEQRLDPGP